MIRKVIEAGNPKLKAKNKRVTGFKSSQIKKLIKDLSDTMYKTDLIGIAAPQIGENYLVFLTHPRDTGARKLIRKDILRVYINPRIIYNSKQKVIIYEGCGSVDNIFGPVLRPKEVEVEASDENGKKFRLCADGIMARVILHEYDHLRGIEFIQKVSDYSKVVVEKNYRKTIRRSKMQVENSQTSKIEFKFL